MGFSLFERWSPEYALNNTFDDMRASGLDGLKKHLTSNALKSIERAESVSGSAGIAMLSTAVMGGNAVSFLLDKLNECEWTIKEVNKESETATAIVKFDYEDKLVGTVRLKMIKESKTWKIDSLAKPKFEKLSLPKKKAAQPAE